MRHACRVSRAGTRRPGTASRRARGSCRSSGRSWTRSQHHQLLRAPWDLAGAVGRDLDHVLDAYAPEAGNIQAGLDRDDGAERQVVGGETVEHGRLVDLESHAVTESVRERIAQPRILDD